MSDWIFWAILKLWLIVNEKPKCACWWIDTGPKIECVPDKLTFDDELLEWARWSFNDDKVVERSGRCFDDGDDRKLPEQADWSFDAEVFVTCEILSAGGELAKHKSTKNLFKIVPKPSKFW